MVQNSTSGRESGRGTGQSARQSPNQRPGRAAEAFEYFDAVVLPAVYENLPSVFPEFGFRRLRSAWQAAKGESDATPLRVRGDRVFVKISKGRHPSGFGVAGGGYYPFTGYVLGQPDRVPRGADFWRAAALLAELAGVDPGPLGTGEPVDRETLRRAQERLDAERRAEQARERRRCRAKVAMARELWEASEAGPGGAGGGGETGGHPAVLRYLGTRRISPALLPAGSLGRLRFCARTPIGNSKTKTCPAVVAAITHTTPTGESVMGVHRTYLGDDGGKHPELGKMMWGVCVGGCVKLGTPCEPYHGDDAPSDNDRGADTLVLCEGIETGLALRAASRLPVWACLSATGLENVQLPAGLVESGVLRRVVVMGDFDDPSLPDKRGQHAMVSAGERIAGLFPSLHVTASAPESYWNVAQTREGAAA